jgi:hypothetical protein
LGPPAAHQRRLDDEDPDRLGRAPQQGWLAPPGLAAASERRTAGAAPPQEEALSSTPMSGVTLGSRAAGRRFVR